MHAWHFECVVDGQALPIRNTSAETLKVAPNPRLFEVVCRASATVQATLVTLDVLEKRSNSVTVRLEADEEKICRARLGGQCFDQPLGASDLVTNNQASIIENCDSQPNRLCLEARASVASLKHDGCCGDNGNGFMCPPDTSWTNLFSGPVSSALSGGRACTKCFIQAACDNGGFPSMAV